MQRNYSYNILIIMKNKSTFYAITMFTLFLLILNTGCQEQQKKSALNGFGSFVDNISKEYEGYTEEDWNKADLKYEEYCSKFDGEYNKILTESEKDQISNLKGKYKGYKLKYNAKNALNNVKDVLNDVGNQVGGFIDALKKDS